MTDLVCTGRHCAEHTDDGVRLLRHMLRRQLVEALAEERAPRVASRSDARKRWESPKDHNHAGMLPHEAPLAALGTHALEEDYGGSL